jgi:hypothetical protein
VRAGRSGPPLLLVHGFGVGAYHFDRNIPELARTHQVGSSSSSSSTSSGSCFSGSYSNGRCQARLQSCDQQQLSCRAAARNTLSLIWPGQLSWTWKP